jgi:hypothetical protein
MSAAARTTSRTSERCGAATGCRRESGSCRPLDAHPGVARRRERRAWRGPAWLTRAPR